MTVGTTDIFDIIGGGAFDDGGGLSVPSEVKVNEGGFTLATIFTFADTVDAGETTVRLFTTYTEGMAAGQTVSFMVSSGTDFTVQGTITPEPTTSALVGGGLLLLAFAGRRRRAQR